MHLKLIYYFIIEMIIKTTIKIENYKNFNYPEKL